MIKIPKEEEAAFIVCVFSLFGKIISCDGQVNEQEERAVAEFIVDSLDLYGKKRDLAIDVFKTAIVSPLNFSDYAKEFYRHFKKREDLRLLILEVLWKISISDRNLSESEIKLLKQAGREFCLPQERVDAISFRMKNQQGKLEILDYYKVLCCTVESTDLEIRESYKRIIGRLSKDKLSQQGVPSEFHSLVDESLENVEKAYQQIKLDRGMKDLDG